MAKIIRTKTKVAGGLSSQETKLIHKIVEEWAQNMHRTQPIVPDKIIPTIESLYAVAQLEKPRVIIVPSPLAMAYVYGAASWIWYTRQKGVQNEMYFTSKESEWAATNNAISGKIEVVRECAHHATYKAKSTTINTKIWDIIALNRTVWSDFSIDVINAVYNSIETAPHACLTDTDIAPDQAHGSVTYDAICAAINAATALTDHQKMCDEVIKTAVSAKANIDALVESMRLACHALAGEDGINCTHGWATSCDAGNLWCQGLASTQASRMVLGLDLPEYKVYQYYEDAARHGGIRVMHKKFCIVSDFPEFIKIDNENRPHCENGPAIQYRDGFSLFYWHGREIPQEWVTW